MRWLLCGCTGEGKALEGQPLQSFCIRHQVPAAPLQQKYTVRRSAQQSRGTLVLSIKLCSFTRPPVVSRKQGGHAHNGLVSHDRTECQATCTQYPLPLSFPCPHTHLCFCCKLTVSPLSHSDVELSLAQEIIFAACTSVHIPPYVSSIPMCLQAQLSPANEQKHNTSGAVHIISSRCSHGREL